MRSRMFAVLACELAVLTCLLLALVLFLASDRRKRTAPPRPRTLSLEGKSVVVVGNASFRRLGEEIDRFDVVVRVNPLDRRPAEDVGRRTDVLHLNDNIAAARLREVPDVDHIWTRNALKTRKQRPHLNTSLMQYDFATLRARHPEFGERCGRNELRRLQLTSGMLAVVHALEHVPVVHCAGLSAYTKESHGARRSDHSFHARNLKNYHCIEQEHLLMKRLIGEGRLRPIDGLVL